MVTRKNFPRTKSGVTISKKNGLYICIISSINPKRCLATSKTHSAFKNSYTPQLQDKDVLKTFPGDPPGAVEEFIALASDILSLGQSDEGDWEEKPQHRITEFSVIAETLTFVLFSKVLVLNV